jgi:hypothetical protein
MAGRMTDDDDDFFSAVDLDENNTPQEERYGLVVPMRAPPPTWDKLGNLILDTIAELERQERMAGRKRIIFIEEEDTDDAEQWQRYRQ